MALPAAFLDELRARTPLPGLIGRRVRLARSGRQWKGCCPFHGEKTPSFYVYDDHFHCFGCGAHGDAIGFVMQSQGAGFTEAVEQLAAEAGLDVPRPSPGAAEADRRRIGLQGVLEAASVAFQRRLRMPEGRAALVYLQGRGLTEETIERFGLGWSGEGRGSLLAELAREGVTAAQLSETGLIRQDDETGRSFDLFYSRVMFPIRDRRGRTISFGGRTLGDAQPKYVNGPETSLFSKRRSLYGVDHAREAARLGEKLVVVEGYMDVIALSQAGFAGAVAPLGTALTDAQLTELWRLSPAPILCFDGDAAGARAAARAAETALPMLAPDRTLSFVSLGGGEDPDSLIRRGGRAGFAAALDTARPMADVLFGLLRQGAGLETPEQRAAFRVRLEDAAKRIPDKALASEYRQVLLDQFYAERRRPAAGRANAGRGAPMHAGAGRGGPGRGNPARGGAPGGTVSGGGASWSGARGGGAPWGGARGWEGQGGGTHPRPVPASDTVATERVRILTAILLRHPALLHDVEHAYADLALPAAMAALRDAIVTWSEEAEILESDSVIAHLTKSGLQDAIENTLATVPVPLPACASGSAMPAEALAGWWHIYGFLNVDRLREEVARAQASFAVNMVAENEARLKALTGALQKVQAGEPDGTETVAA